MNHPINSLIGGPPSSVVGGHGNAINNTASSTSVTGPGPGGGITTTNTINNNTGAVLPIQQMFGSFDANMASSVTLACCQSLCDVLTELPLPTAVQDKSSHTRSLITGLNVNMTTARNTLLNDLTIVPQIQQALFMAKQNLSDTTFHTNHLNNNNNSNNNNSSTTSPASNSSTHHQSPSTDPQSSSSGAGPSPSHNPSQLLHELLARGCFLNNNNSQLLPAAATVSASTPSSSTTQAIGTTTQSIYPSSSSSSTSATTGTTSSNTTNDNSIVNDLHSIEPSIKHIPDLHQNLMNDLINDECCDPTMSTTTTTSSTSTTNDIYSQQQQQHHNQQNSSVLTGSQQQQQHHGQNLMSNNNDYSQINHQQQRIPQHHHQQQQQDVNNTIKIEPDHQIQQQFHHDNHLQQQQQQQLQNQNYSSLGERVKSRQREAAAKAIQANAAALGTNHQPYYNQQPNDNSQAMLTTINNNDTISDQMYNNNNNNNNVITNQMSITRANIKNEYQQQQQQQQSSDDKDWQLPNSSSLQRKSSTTSSSSSSTTTTTTSNYVRKPLYQQPPVRPKVEMVKPQIRSVKYEFTDIDNDSIFLSKSVDIVNRFEQIIDQILQISCNDFNNYYYNDNNSGDDNDNLNSMNEYNDNIISDNNNDYYNYNDNNNQFNKYHHHHYNQQHNNKTNNKSYNNNNNSKRLKSGSYTNHHVNGMSFNVSIDSDQLKEIMILSAKLKQTNRIGEIERKKLILFLTVLSNQLNIWLTRYKSKSSHQNHNDNNINDEDDYNNDNENERQHYWELCCNASQSALHIMTSTTTTTKNHSNSSTLSGSDQLISLEELIEVIVDFLSNNLSSATHVTTTSTKSSKSKSSSSSSMYNQYQHFGVSKRHVTRWTQLLQLLFEFINLRTKGSLTDTLILSLTRISMSALFLLQNTAEMQFVSIEILCHVFEEYQKHRISILEELLNSLSKIPTKKSHRKDSVLTQMLIRLTNAFFQPDLTQQHTRDSLTKQSTAALQIISSFLSHFLRKCHQHSSGGGGSNSDVDFKLIFESLLNDLLDQIHSPHQTASIMIVQVIIKLLISYLAPPQQQQQQQQNKSQTSSLSARLLALEYLSIVCSKFALFLAEKDETIKELQTTFSTIEQETDIKPSSKKNKHKQQQESEQKQKDTNFVIKVYNYLIDYFNSEKLYREKLCLGSIWIKDKYFVDNEQNEQLFLQKLNQSKFNEDSGSVVAISTAALCIQYMEFVHFSTNTRLFDISIYHVTASLSNTSNTTQRSRAMKCLSTILSSSTIDRATQLLSRTDLQNAMRSALLDPSTSVREATVDLIGRFVLQSKDQNLVQRYSDLIGDRILDTGISVRKRVIKILRDFCIEFPEYEKCGEMAVKIVRRINDDGEGIRRLVVDTCRDLWFTNQTQITKFKVYSLLHVIANMINDNASMESMQSLFDQLIKSDTMPIAQQICDSIMNDVLIDDMPQSTKKTQLSAVQCVAMMTQCCPELMIKHCDTLQSLMSLPCETIIEISLRMKVIQTIERVLPHIHNPSPYLLTRIEEDLTKNILQSSANIIQYSVKCLSVLIKNHTKNTKLAVELFCKFQQILYQYRNLLYDGHNEQQVKPKLLRAIFTCGLFAKYFSSDIVEYRDRVRDTFIELILSPYDVDIKCKSIVALGFIIESDPKICLLPNVIEIYTRILRNEQEYQNEDNNNQNYQNIQTINRKNDELFCIQVLNNFRNYLSESIESDENAVKTIEWSRESLKSMQSSEDDSGSTQSQIIQKYLNSILINALNPNISIRRVACNVIHVIHSGGHVHPLQLVPHLVAMTCDDDYQIRVRADHVLHDIERKYHGYVAMKAKEAVQLSALFCKKLNCSGFRIIMEKSSSSSTTTQDGQTLISMPTTSKEICSRLSTLYQVICTNRQSRRGFISSLLRHFDTSEFVVRTTNSTDVNSSTTNETTSTTTFKTKPELIDIEFFVESILFFPYTVFDEILYILNQLECTSSINSTHVTQLFKEIFIVERSQSSSNEEQNQQQQQINFINQQQQPQIIYDQMGNAQIIYPFQQQQQQMMMNSYQQQQQLQSNMIDIEDIDLENEDQLKKYENNIHVNFDLLLSDRNNERLTNLIRSLRTIYLQTLLRTLLKEFYLLKDEKINDYSTNDAKTWEKPVHRRQIESIHLKELFNLAKPNIEIQESLLLNNDLQNVEKQLLNEWKRFRQVSLNNNDPNFKQTLLTKLFQFGSTQQNRSLSNVQRNTINNNNTNNNNNDEQQQQQQNVQNTNDTVINCIGDNNNNNNEQQSTPTNNKQSNRINSNSNKKSKQQQSSTATKKKRKRIVLDDDSDESPYIDDDDENDEDYQGF